MNGNLHKVEEEDLRILPLNVPEVWESEIPDHLTENLTKREKATIHTLSRVAKKQDWTIGVVEADHKHLVRMDRRMIKLEKAFAVMAGRWAPIFWLGGMIITAFVSRYMNKLLP